MKTRITLACCLMVAGVLTVLSLPDWSVAWGEQPQQRSNGVAVSGQTFGGGGNFSRARKTYIAQLIGRPNAPTDAKIDAAMTKLQEAKNDEKKSQAKSELSRLLIKYFDADMKRREQDILNIEKQVKKLRAQYEKRRAAKDKIVDLQLQVMINEADGLGFYGQPVSNYSGF